MRGYKEEGTTTTPFDMAMLNGIDHFQLAIGAVDRVPGLAEKHSLLRQNLQGRRMQARIHPHARRGPGGDPELGAQRLRPRVFVHIMPLGPAGGAVIWTKTRAYLARYWSAAGIPPV